MQLNYATDKDVEGFRHLLNYLRRLTEDGVTPLIETPLLLLLDTVIPFFSTLVMSDVFPEIHRLSVNRRVVGKNQRIHEIKYLKNPPRDKVLYYGRCNYPLQSVFYGAFDFMTPLNELRPRVGDLITHSVWRVKNNNSLKYCPIFLNQPSGGKIINIRTSEITLQFIEQIKQYQENFQKQIWDLNQFVADAFTREIRYNNHLDYIFSAYFANKIFFEFEGGTIDAIYYPSVKEKLSFENIAIKSDVFDSYYELVEVNDSVVRMDPSNGRGGYMMDGLGKCKNFSYSDGEILWDPKQIMQPKEKLVQLIKKFNLELGEFLIE